jgi:hypothetical protein
MGLIQLSGDADGVGVNSSVDGRRLWDDPRLEVPALLLERDSPDPLRSMEALGRFMEAIGV